jgi:FKBP-type peptidyl-prolyl cis-trans isomerase FkpA
MKLPALRLPTPARRTFGLSVVLSLLAAIGCASSGASSTVLADTAFERSLQVDLSSMTKTPSGLYYRDEVEGRGEIAKQRQKVTVRYTGWLPNGTKFDSSESLEFRLSSGPSGVIEGWVIGIEGMRVGGVRKLVIPPELGYRYREAGPIPAGSVLVFRIELLRVRQD